MNPKANKINTAIIAAGRIGVMHAENLIRHIPEARLKAVFDKYKRSDWLKNMPVEVHDILVTDDLDTILKDSSIEAVIIASSTTSHVPLIEQILPYKKNIFCEKPISLRSSIIKGLMEKVVASGVVFQVGYNRRFDPDFIALKERLASNEIGKMHLMKVINRDPLRPPLDFIPKSGGLVFDFNVHDFDMIHFLSEEKVEEVVALGGNLIDPKIGELGDIDTILINLKLGNGTLVNVDCSRETNYGYDQQIEVLGEKGSLGVTNIREHSLVSSSESGVNFAKPKFDFVSRYEKAFLNQMKSFYEAISMKKAPLITIEDARNALCVAEAVAQSLKTKQVAKVIYD